MKKCILYDLDGVLVDACEWHYLALNESLSYISNIKITRYEHEGIYNGLPTAVKLNMLCEEGRISKSDITQIWSLKQKITKDIILRTAKIDEEKIYLHQFMSSLGIKIACVTNSISETASLMLKATGQLQYMDLLVTNDVITYPKPHGEGYINAMVRLGCFPSESLIVEDSDKGIIAAESTGASVFKVKGPTDVNIPNILQRIK